MKKQYNYYFVYAISSPDGTGVAEGRYKLIEKEYLSVRNQILNGENKVSFVQEDGEPICFSLNYPVAYAKTEKREKLKHIVTPDDPNPGIIKN